jgi:hypothetical protein
MINLKDFEGSGRGLIEVLSWRDRENHEEPQSEKLVSRLRLEPSTSTVQF